ncbi:MAG: T9SS type A sorting domain-containing protein [Bacteroidales bacterium]|nr:T9SS type A sorting domain-containing protein [Bacteroidales bacterium]
MTKNITLFYKIAFCAMLSLPFAAWCQFQIPNNGFEQWDGGYTSEPTHWNTFSSSDGSYSSLASSNHHYRRSGHRPGGSGNYYLTIYTKSIMGIKANGNMTTGRVHAGSTSATSSDNYNYTQRDNSSHCLPFTATPDSLYAWVSFYAESGNSEAQITAILHGDNDFKSPNNENNTSLYKARAEIRTKRTTGSASSMAWRQIKVPFVYSGTSSASYLLVNMTTNRQAGEGSKNDSLSIDDIQLIYSAWLTDIKVNGETISGFEKGRLNYTIHVDDIDNLTADDIQATTEVDDASVQIQVSLSDINTDTDADIYVTVTAEDGTEKEYYILATTRPVDVGIEANTKETARIFPNPANETITIDMNHSVEIIDITGHSALRFNSTGTNRIDVSHLAKGVYTVLIDGTKTTKLIINR